MIRHCKSFYETTTFDFFFIRRSGSEKKGHISFHLNFFMPPPYEGRSNEVDTDLKENEKKKEEGQTAF